MAKGQYSPLIGSGAMCIDNGLPTLSTPHADVLHTVPIGRLSVIDDPHSNTAHTLPDLAQ